MVIASRSTWACELKSQYLRCSFQAPRHAPRERVSWNCDKLFWVFRSVCHAPRERVSWNVCAFLTENFARSHAPRERVSWNSNSWRCYRYRIRHAPRERVSWNEKARAVAKEAKVTLHVSVWVEISHISLATSWSSGHAPRERVSWNLSSEFLVTRNEKSRSTWACELKYTFLERVIMSIKVTLHVSVWVEIYLQKWSSWRVNVTLHVSVWVEISMLKC